MNQVAINGAELEIGALEIGLLTLGVILSLVAFVCSIVVIVKMFQNEQTAMGIICLLLTFCSGIGQLIALVIGWMKVSEWNIKGLMVTFTGSFILGAALAMAGYGIMISKMMNNPEIRQQLEEMEIPAIEVEQ